MKVNIECVRDVILHIEEHLKYDGTMDSELIVDLPKFKQYNPDDVRYAIKQLCKENMLEYGRNVDEKFNPPQGGRYEIYDVNPEGHKFCDLIRKESEWKKCFSKICTLSNIANVVTILSKLVPLFQAP
ncbi:MAG: DUF2513 domain-containing protein [Ruminococcus sp.]|nr:DUF2513 domain-containing protein [Ruminococcus sp.]MCM1380296.1 DUF2513 domain-containing protein [Muribaculaceae bacterium]MCM1478276.1 DUF2513 domain-containing protein [Muribaculaceae bacterium]